VVRDRQRALALILTGRGPHDRFEITTRAKCGRSRRPADAERECHEPDWIWDQTGQEFGRPAGLAQFAVTVDAFGKAIERLGAEAEEGGLEMQPLPQPARLNRLLENGALAS
jgi:hypothetical protein